MRKKHRAELAQEAAAISPAEAARARIDAEPKQPHAPILHIGSRCWFIDSDARWFEVELVERKNMQITFKSATGWDSERVCEWPYGDLLEFSQRSPLYRRLRPLSARRK